MTSSDRPKLFLCLPLLDEFENIPHLTDIINKQQTSYDFEVIFCVNQPHHWWHDKSKKRICENNQQTLKLLSDKLPFAATVIDKSTHGWDDKHYGVGWARKTAMDAAADKATDNDLIFSMDADTYYPPSYLEQTADSLLQNPTHIAAAIPYYHPLSENKTASRAILRYEMYMRNYALNMWRIGSPYRFTALGSAIALPAWAYRKVGGITPKVAGEDFYFLQKLTKSGKISYYNPVKAYPQARFSDRVLFGTGPAMQKGKEGNWVSYPIYHPEIFDELKSIYKGFNAFFEDDRVTEDLGKLSIIYPNFNWLSSIKKNASSKKQFLQQCHTNFDGLKTLQYLKRRQGSVLQNEEEILRQYLLDTYPEKANPQETLLKQLDFNTNSISDLNNVRNLLVAIEDNILEKSSQSLSPGENLNVRRFPK